MGGIVPAGSYDRAAAQWVAGDNGRVIAILGVDGSGRAALDLDGSATPADATALAALGITGGERRRLALLYATGHTLWRTPIPHFSPSDLNWPAPRWRSTRRGLGSGTR